jgi:hypothetical protein
MMATAKTGIDALVDEATEYEKIRPKGELAEQHQSYLQEEENKAKQGKE